MSVLLSPIEAGKLTLRNRFMRSSVWEKMSDASGVPSQRLIGSMVDLAKGQVGLILPGVVFPYDKARLNAFQAGFCTVSQIEEWRAAVDGVHRNGSKIMFQFSHGGLGAAVPRSPSATEKAPEMTVPEIEEFIEAIVHASIGAKQIGADGVQLQCAQGFLLSRFLSPLTNHRNDRYGGSLENRMRIVQEAVDAIKQNTDRDFPVSIKINGDDCVNGGITPKLAAEMIHRFKNIDLFEISCAINGGFDGIRPSVNPSKTKFPAPLRREAPYHEGYNVIAAAIIKRANPDKVIAAVGGLRDFNFMESIVENKMVDIVSIARPFIREPDLIQKYIDHKKTVADCLSCNQCMLNPGNFIHCHFPKE